MLLLIGILSSNDIIIRSIPVQYRISRTDLFPAAFRSNPFKPQPVRPKNVVSNSPVSADGIETPYERLAVSTIVTVLEINVVGFSCLHFFLGLTTVNPVVLDHRQPRCADSHDELSPFPCIVSVRRSKFILREVCVVVLTWLFPSLFVLDTSSSGYCW